MAVMGPRPAAFVRDFDPATHGVRLAPLVHRWVRGRDLSALMLILQRMLRESGSIERFFMAGDDSASPDIGPALEAFSTRALATDVRAAYGRVPAPRSVVLFSATFRRQRVQAVEPVPAVDGANRCDRSRVWTHVSPSRPRPSRYARDSAWAMSAPDPLQESGLEIAAEITASLRAIDSGNPVRSISRCVILGMMNACGFERPQKDTQCPLRRMRPSQKS